MWTEVGSVGFGYDVTATKVNCDDDNDDDFEAALSSVEGTSDFDVMSHSFSADNMLTLTRRNHHHHSGCRHAANSGTPSGSHDQSSVSSSRRQRRQVAFSEESNSVVVVVDASGTQATGDVQSSTAPYFSSSGDSSDEGGSNRTSPVPGIDPTSADFETALEADVAADDDSFDSTDDDDEIGDFQSSLYSPPLNAVSTPSPVRRAADHLQSLQIHQHGSEMYVGGTEVRLRRKKVDAIPADEAAIMGLWQWKNSTASSSSDGDHSHCLSDAIENCELFVTAPDYPTLLASHGDKDPSVIRRGSVSRTCDREISISPETAVHVGQLTSQPNTLQSRMTERLRKRTYRIGLNLFNK